MEWVTTSTILGKLGDFEDEAAWGRFVRRFRLPVLSFAQSVGLTAAEAEDVAQETLLAFADAYREGRYDRAKGRLSRWLFGIAYRQILRRHRHGQRGGQQQATTFWQHLEAEDSASALWDVEWEQSVLRQCLDRARCEFEPATFQAFELVVCDERSPAEAADLLGVPTKSVYNAKHRVLKRVRELRSDYEEVS